MSFKRQPSRKTSSIYSASTVSVQNIELPPTVTFLSHLNAEQKFEYDSTKPTCDSKHLPPLQHYEKKVHCEKFKGKKICVNVEQIPIIKTENLKICRPRPKPLNQTIENKLIRSTFCKKDSRFSLPPKSVEILDDVEKILKQKPKKKSTGKRISNFTIKSQINSKLPEPCAPSLFGDQKNKYMGKCSGKELVKKLPHEKHDHFNFTLTEDPRQINCLRNPYFRDKKIDFIESVKLADNVSTDKTTDDSTLSICEEIDLENPYNLDFQGVDYQVSYENDEQNFENVLEYRDIKRYRDRRVTKVEVADNQAQKELEEKFAVPEIFDINYEYIEGGEKQFWSIMEPVKETIIDEYKLAKIYRTQEKSFNKTLTEFEINQRKGRYLNLYLTRKELEKEQEKLNDEKQKETEENKCFNIGQNIFDNAVKQEIINNYEELKSILPSEKGKRNYPHNLKETKRLRHKMKKSKLIIREKAKVREQFYREMGKNRMLEEARLEISDLSATLSSISEQITDDEDNLVIGPVNSQYKLRGFHYGLGTQIRGKFQKHELLGGNGKAVQGCMTRNEWFKTIHSEKKTDAFYKYNPPPVPLFQDPNDSKLALFPPKPLEPKPIDESPVLDIIQQPIGFQYIKAIVKNLNIKKPKTVKVKKFNLTGYMYGTVDNEHINDSDNEYAMNTKSRGFGNLLDYIYSKIKNNKLRKRRERRQRMHYLGIPFNTINSKKKHQPCVHSSTSESSDWIPPDDKIKNLNIITMAASVFNFGRSHAVTMHKGIIGPKKISHPYDLIPAPAFRQPTVRDTYYEKFKDSPRNIDIPYLFPPEPDKRIPPNLCTMKKNYMKVLGARHHHDHLDPTQHKLLHAKYKIKSPKLKTEATDKNDEKDKMDSAKKGFLKAIPDRIELRDMDLTLPKYKEDYINSKDIFQYVDQVNDAQHNNQQSNNMPSKTEADTGGYHSLETQPTNFEGHDRFIQLIEDMLKELKRQQHATGIFDEDKEIIDKDEYLNELNEELLSIKSCLSSLSSSICTNFTNDSGSYLMIQDKKVPMDYVRKSLVPFEELNRVRVKAEPSKRAVVNRNPYKTCPFAGQLQEQTMRTFEKFHTFKTRIQNDVRARLQVPAEELKNKLLGPDYKRKYHPLVATDLDEIYIKELHNRPPIKIFKPKSTMQVVKSALRKKYVCWSIQQKIVELKAAQEIELCYYDTVIKLKDLLKQLFQKWEKQFYEASMQTLSKVKPYYELTDKMKKKMFTLEQKHLSLNMEIIMIEDDFRRRVVLQNFHYLIMKTSWRETNDWIHLNEDGELENYRDSIQKRYIVNVRQRDRDDAWIIKEYYDNVYLKNLHAIEIVFPDTQSFIDGVNSLKSKTFVCLLELHFAMWVWTTLEQKLNQFLTWSKEFLLKQTKFVRTKCAKKYFMEDRQHFLMQKTKLLMNIPLADSISRYDMRVFMATCDVVYEKVVPSSVRAAVKADIDVVDKTSLIWDTIVELLTEIDSLPIEKFLTTEKSYRRRLKYDLRMSKAACQIEKRIFTSMEEVKRNLAPPFVKPKREGKLPRLFLKKKKPPEKPKEKPISEKTKFFYYAFHGDDDILSSTEDLRGSIEILGNIQDDNVPFHFDHFLRLNDYIPNYNFKTQIELDDGPEEEFLKNRDLLPDVFAKLQAWETAKQTQLESDIKRYSHMYENVKI